MKPSVDPKGTELDISDECDKVTNDAPTNGLKVPKKETSNEPYKVKIIWTNVIFYVYLHLASVYAVYLMFTSAKWKTNLFAFFLYNVSSLGITAGAHRLWTHRSYKAKLPLRILLAFNFTISGENDIFDWVRNHRVHHKYSETDADPHNAKRGFFFAHMGWLLCRKHPEVIKKGSRMDFSDLQADPVVYYQKKYFKPLLLICCFILPTIVPMYFWGETFINAFFIPGLFRFCFTLHITWLVNSAAHMWGQKPYDININPAENILVAIGAVGEGFHNFHHTFPYDYATGEYGIKYNLTTAFIDTMAWLGLAYDRKMASKKVIEARKLKTGPGSRTKNE